MIWLQSIVCSAIFVVNFAFHPGYVWLSVTLNILLGISCLGLLITVVRRQSTETDRPDVQSLNTDRVRNIIVIVLALLCVAATLARLNGTSTAVWKSVEGKDERNAGLIVGTAKGIRADEWLVQTPWTWSQAKQDPPFPSSNRNVGNYLAPLVTNLPVWHWSALFRPQMWGFFFLTTESAFAVNWNLKWFAMLLSGFLFFRIVGRRDNFLALSASLILLFASYIQWWFSTPTCMPEMISMIFFGLWALHLICHTASRWIVTGAGLLLLAAIEQFAFCSYPRFQIPLAYLAVALLAGGWASYCDRPETVLKPRRYFHVACLILILAVAAILLWRWAREIRVTVEEIQGLIYPGQVVSTGGDFRWYRLWAPLLEFGMTEDHYPVSLGNVCEASGFIFLAPVLVAALVRDLWQRRFDALFTAVVLFLALSIAFVIWGVPISFARSTGLLYVASSRAILVIGVASIIGLVRYLGRGPSSVPGRNTTLVIGVSTLTLGLFSCLYAANARLDNFASLFEVIAVSLFFSLVFCLIWRRARLATCILLLVPSLYANGLVNPVSRGLPGLARNSALHRLERIHKTDPKALWLVATDSPASSQSLYIAQFLKATGASVLGGVRCMPDHEMVRVLDPENRYATVYTRFAGIFFILQPSEGPVFELLAPGHYQVRLPMEPPVLESLGVRYLVLADRPEGATVPGFEPIGAVNDLVILRRR